MKKYRMSIQRMTMALAMLMMFSMGAWAQKVDVVIDTYTGGKVIETDQSGPDGDGMITVTISVEPDNGYTISKNDITVVSTYDPKKANTRSPEIAAPLTLSGDDPADLSAKRKYTFKVSPTFGVWVKEAKFSSGSKEGGTRSLPVEITTDDNNNGTIDDTEKKLYLIQTNAFQSFYIAPQANNNNTITITTNNILGDYMLWYFLDAGKGNEGTENEIQYYYIVNNSTGKYIYNHNGNSRGINITDFASLTDANKEKCKFKLVVDNSNNTTDFYNIDVKASQTYYGLNKQSGSEGNTGTPIRLTNDQYIHDTNSKWKFIPYNGTFTWPDPPFELSTNVDKHYYKIRNVQSNTFYASTDATPDKVTYSNTESNSMVWYFKEAPSDPSTPWFKYYYIVNPKAGNKYMYYSGNVTDGSNQTDVVSVEDYDSNNDDRFQFVVVQAAKGDGNSRVDCYAIIPKLLRENYWTSNSIGSTSITNGTNMGIISSRSTVSNNTLKCNAHWQFVLTNYPLKCVAPTITYSSATGKITIASTTSGNTIHYTTDGVTEPTSSVGTQYSAPFVVSGPITIKAIATKTGFDDSEVTTKSFVQVATPSIQDNGSNAISITCATEGSTIYYTTNGDTPNTTSTEYTGPLTENISGVTIKAIAVKDGMINSTVASGSVTLKCAKPVIVKSGDNVTISCNFPASGVSIYYTKNGDDPNSNSTLYSGAIPVSLGDVIKAIAFASGYTPSEVATKTIRTDLTPTDGKYLIKNSTDFETFVDMANEVDGASYHYILQTDVYAGPSITEPFTGVFEVDADANGNFYTISGLTHPLFNNVNGGTVKNVILESVSISSGTNVGAICGEATGNTRIYNCGVLSGSVGGSDNVGGIVGLLDGSSRVINCYNYANITSGSNCGGIVGYNNVASTSGNLQTMVMNCMFYGNITGGNAAPIYGGAIIHNKYASTDDTGLNNYCYFLYDEEKNPYVTSIADDNYHGALGAEERFLNRFEFFRMTLNSTRNMAAFYVIGDATQKGEIAKWVLDKNIAPYPILKVQDTYPSIVNPDAAHATTQTERNKGGKLGSLSVTIGGTGSGAVFGAPTGASITTTGSLTLNITDKDYDNFNYNYRKVQLPYYNEVGTGNYTKASDGTGRVVTGWKITSITGGTPGSFTTNTYDYPSFNFVDRKCTNKDLYSVSGRVFAQGAYWEVPDGVTSITIEPYWAKAVYLTDANYDMTYTITISGSGSSGTATANKYGVTVCGSCPTDYNGQTVYTDLSTAITNLGSNADHTVYDYAVVLVGNYHQAHNNALVNNGKPVTFMSADLDGDNEPDNTLFYYHNQRRSVSPIRFDFLNIPGIGMVKRTYNSSMAPEPGILAPKGWFEITNTVFIRFGQFEYAGSNPATKTILAPLILQGGIYEQFVSCCRTNAQNTNYLLIGGNAWFKNFANGCHTAQANKTPKVPINVTGGDYTNFYLTGIYQPGSNEPSENAECYIDGGRFQEVAGSGMQQVKGDVTWLINAADITHFFGGGINAAKPITGSISTTISNSYVDEFYGGPKFGDMKENMTVTTNATDCHFGKFFGAGYGGTAFNRVGPVDDTAIGDTRGWNGYVNSHYKRAYNAGNGGISTNYDYEFILSSDGNNTVARFFVDYASLSLASTRNVTSTLSGCTIGTFYGGGSLGAVNGDVNSTLTNCTVTGNAFGAGFSASVPTVEVWNAGAYLTPNPTYNRTANVFNNASVKTPKDNNQYVVYTWSNSQGSNESPFTDTNDGKHYIYTNVSLNGLGTVTGKATLTINGTTVAKSVYGGGEESGVGDGTEGDGTEVIITSGTIGTQGQGGVEYGNVFGGGKGKVGDKVAGYVKGNTAVNISQVENKTTTIFHNVYGGGAYGSVGDFTYDATSGMPTALAKANTGACTVTITGGTIGSNGHENGMVFGSSRGDVATLGTDGVDPNDRMAWVYSTHVTIGDTDAETSPSIKGSVYGSGENGHTFQNTIVDINKGIIGITDTSIDGGAAYAYRGNVYGGGCGTDKYDSDNDGVKDKYNPLAGIVRGSTTINISGGHVVRNVYGAGAMGSVGGGATTDAGKTTINVTGGRIGYDGDGNGHVFGAARGEYGISTAASGLANVRETEVNINYATTPTADNEGKTEKLIAGSVFGGGESGTVKESVAVNMTGGLILKDIYGGGALADTQTSNWNATGGTDGKGDWATGKSSASATTTVSATGGIVKEEIYGGALGEAGKPAYVWGDVLVELNKGVDDTAKGCVVTRVFGCNNTNGTPKGDVTVHIYATQNAAANQIANTPAKEASGDDPAVPAVENAKVSGRYDVSAVYGGGNEATYNPVTPSNGTEGSKTQVIIEGCDRTSIETVYGGGNAAAVPETNLDIMSAYEIHYVFGGGNGKDKRSDGSDNPGADVGVLDKAAYEANKENGTYGTGNANSTLKGGYIHEAYGGSNQKGIVKGSLNQTSNPDESDCDLIFDKVVGAGKYADIDGDVNMVLSCQPSSKVPQLFAGADEANVNGNITLTITNGHFGDVFGGNNLGGAVKGKITVNVEETGCQPIIIDNLYLGGNKAAYSIYGYYESNVDHPVTGKKILEPRKSATDQTSVPNPATDATHTFPYAQPELNIISCTYIGNVFGGGLGKEAIMYASPTVNINMIPGRYAAQIDRDGDNTADNDANLLGAIGDVFGGGNAADIYGNTTINIGTKTAVETVTEHTHLTATDGKYTVLGAYITGNVYGGGNEADVIGNSNVNVSGDNPTALSDVKCKAVVLGNIYGGGNLGSVGDFTRTAPGTGHTHAEGETCIGGKPTSLKTTGTGKCAVIVDGWAEIGPNGMQMTKEGGPDDIGYVFGASRGEVKDPTDDIDMDYRTYVYETDVTIGGHAFIKGSVYGGSENGRVLGDTDVKIQGNCQIGAGAGVNTRYDEALFIDPSTDAGAALIETSAATLKECASWDYKSPYLPYDKYDDSEDVGSNEASTTATDGHTFYGNVFGGGSGLYAYKKKDNTGYEWLRTAGRVEGNTNVTITGGHILTSVYGGCELTDVGNGTSVETDKGKCTVKMSGGTLGVPRTLTQIAAHPVTCYLFGAGKGDPRTRFNQWTNVGKVEVEVSGGIIYGSVFGGGEDGHVLGNVDMTIKEGAVIGTWGTSYVDGNVFGAGRGFGGEALTAGVVCGNVDIDILGGNILGSVYGGGRLGSVGTYLVPPTVSASSNDAHPKYGKLIPDGKKVTIDESNWTVIEEDGGGTHGYVTIDISGGTIGNNYEYDYIASTVAGDDLTTAKAKMLNTLLDDDNRLLHTKGGNVFAGAMGRREQLDGKTPITQVDWHELGKVKSTKLTIRGNAWIKSNVYGGGELGAVEGTHTTGGKNYATEIVIEGTPTIGTLIGPGINGGSKDITSLGSMADDNHDKCYTFGSVYGGGYGTEKDVVDDPETTANEAIPYTTDVTKFAAFVSNDTKVNMSAGTVMASVYGGGEVACVGGNTNVDISGGSIGVNELRKGVHPTMGANYVLFGSWRMGNVYGGGRGSENAVIAGLVAGDANVNISGSPGIYHNVYGGGAIGSVGTFSMISASEASEYSPEGAPKEWTKGGTATVIIKGTPTIGINGHDNGMVNGSSRGDVSKPHDEGPSGNTYKVDVYDKLGWVNKTVVSIGTSGSETGPAIKGSVYGGGENGHNGDEAKVDIYSGTIGIEGTSWATCGNVFGAGCGTDTYTGTDNKKHHNRTAGFVMGDSFISIHGGHVYNSVYGGGSMGSLGIDGKKATVAITGGTIEGSVYGGPKGDPDDTETIAHTKATDVTMAGGTVKGSVFGGGESGVVEGSVVVKMSGGNVEKDVYGGGALADTNDNNTTNTSTYTTTVSLTGGTITGYAYGGGLGRKAKAAVDASPAVGVEGQEGYQPAVPAQAAVAAIEALVKGDVTVELNKGVEDNARGCVVSQIFGCNNLNGTPQGNVEVHVYKTQRAGADQIVNTDDVTNAKVYGTLKPGSADFELSSFDVEAVYGGGNKADYIPGNGTNQQTYVVIEGCDRTSIGNVYGGGNAAAVPGTTVLIKGSYEIGEVFGGGNGVVEGTRANVGFDNKDPHTDYTLGDGKAVVQLMAGKVRYVYGGSNTRGDIRGGSTVTNVTNEWTTGNTACCESMQVDHIFGGGKNAEMTGGANIIMGCTNSKDWVAEIFPGAENANIGGPVNLTITSGMFGRVFGGNKTSGKIKGSITVNIEENGKCGIPIIIGELYGGGFKAPYSVYGFDDNGVMLTSGTPKYADPQINVRAFTSIGNIYGGGYGDGADMYGNPRVNINEVKITHTDTDITFSGNEYGGTTLYFVNEVMEPKRTTDPTGGESFYKVTIYRHADKAMGVVGNVYGGGNAAAVHGDTYVNIGTTTEEALVVLDNTGNPVYTDTAKTIPQRDNPAKPVAGADIRGNVYGGGNKAAVTGNTHVVIGKEETPPASGD